MKSTLNQPKNKRLLAVFAHPDDEVFCAGGTLARVAALGVETMVVSVTQGEAGQIQQADAATRRTLGRVRQQEFYESCKRLGVQHAICLDYGDGTLQSIDPTPLTQEITEIIRAFQPDTVITFGPDGAYGHPDHIVIGDITTQAVTLAGESQQFSEHLVAGLRPYSPPRLYYSYFPRNRRFLSDRLGHWLVDQSRRFEGTVDFAHALMLFAQEATMLGYANDHVETSWFPAGFHIVEQGESANKLYLILSGQAEVRREESDGTVQTVAQIGPGHFFGEEGLAYQQPRNAHVVAVEGMTCLVFSLEAPSNFAGRGAGTHPTEEAAGSTAGTDLFSGDVLDIDVSDFVAQKVAAMAAHRTQFSFEEDMLPLSILREMFGREYFVRVPLPVKKERHNFSITDLLPIHRSARSETASYAVS